MSIHALSWVLKHSEARLGQRLVLLVYADHADGEGVATFPAIDTVAHEARLSRRATINAINELRASGRLVPTGARPSGTVEYAVRMDPAAEGGADFAPRANDAPEPSLRGVTAKGGNGVEATATATATTPSVAKNRGQREEDFEGGRPLRLTYKGKPVPEEMARRAVLALRAYGEAAGQAAQPWKPDGAATPELKRVLGAVLDHPEATTERWAQTVQGVLAAPWWSGAPSVGVVFGPNVVAANLRNPTRGGAKRETASQRAAREKEERIKQRHERAYA